MRFEKEAIVTLESNLRLDALALNLFPRLGSRSQSKKQIKKGLILLNGAKVEPSRRPRLGDRISISIEQPRTTPLNVDLEILHLDDDVAVVFKPAGLYTSGNHKYTLRRVLMHNIPIAQAVDGLPNPEPCHRLDRRVSGLVLCARTQSALIMMNRQFVSGSIQKLYYGIVLGKAQMGQSELPIDGKPSKTSWRPLQVSQSQLAGHFTLLEIKPRTGRTHQIRKHLTAAGHPLLGDDLYHDGRIRRGKGLFLMSGGIEFTHPRTGKQTLVKAPLPDKFTKTMDREHSRYERLSSESPIPHMGEE